MSYKTRRILLRAAFYVLVAVIFLYTVFPFYWAIVSSLKAGSSLFEVDFVPPDPPWTTYVPIFQEHPFARNILNSVFISILTVNLSLSLTVTTAFALGRFHYLAPAELTMFVHGH